MPGFETEQLCFCLILLPKVNHITESRIKVGRHSSSHLKIPVHWSYPLKTLKAKGSLLALFYHPQTHQLQDFYIFNLPLQPRVPSFNSNCGLSGNYLKPRLRKSKSCPREHLVHMFMFNRDVNKRSVNGYWTADI